MMFLSISQIEIGRHTSAKKKKKEGEKARQGG